MSRSRIEPDRTDVIEVVVVDDHPAVRAGLAGLIDAEAGLVCVSTAGTAADAIDAVRRQSPAVVVVDYDLPDGDGLTLCADLKDLPNAPRVILYSAFATPRLLPAAAIAGIDAMLDKAAPSEHLFAAVRRVATGGAHLPAAPQRVRQRCLERLDADDIALFAMVVNGTDAADIARVMRLDPDETRRRLRALLGRLQERRSPEEAGDG
jgi:DNA-binding NarL/FixJ family response regulator